MKHELPEHEVQVAAAAVVPEAHTREMKAMKAEAPEGAVFVAFFIVRRMTWSRF